MRRVVQVVILSCVAAGCGAPPPPAPTARNIVLVTIDTLRADRVGAYGAREVATPNLDRLAREGALAADASVHVPLTRPSHVSLLTGLYPAEHGIRDNVSPSLADDVPLLPEMARHAGFHTGAFVSSVVLSKQSGLARGFETYSDRFEIGEDDARFLNTIQKRGDGTTAEAISWLEAQPKDARLFLWLHLYDPHDPYEPPEPYASRYAGRPYDGEVAWSDDLVGRLDAALTRLDRREGTLLVVTSDHGEGLGEHGESVHGYFVYETTLRVPLIFRGPGIRAGSRIEPTVRTVDLLPTMLELAGIQPPKTARLAGRSIARALRGTATATAETAYAECLVPLLHFGWSDLRSLREGRWKYIQAPRAELYDLKTDPGETRDLIAMETARADAMRAALAKRLGEEKARADAAPGAAGVPPELLEKLGALGYVGAGTTPSATTGADPKDKLEDYKLVNRSMREGLVALREQRYDESASHLRGILARGIESFEVHYYLGRALAGRSKHREAIAHFEKALAKLPGYGAAFVAIADSRMALGDARGAIEAIEKGAVAAPKDSSIPRAEARMWRRLERPADAIRAYERALALSPNDALLKVQLGEMHRDRGDLDRAIGLMREAVRLDPMPASYWNSLGMVLGTKGDMAEAEKAFREAVARDGSEAQYSYNLGLALQRQGRRDEAAPHFRKALALQPRFGAARERLAEVAGR